MRITLHIPQHALRDAAARSAGLNPQALAMKPGTRPHRDRRAAAKRGDCKHKGRAFD